MQIHLNGGGYDAPESATILLLLETIGLAPARVAVEVNGRIVPRDEYHHLHLHEQDRVEVVHFVGGG
jgi:thiamine biosynthesis protein ThiS